MLFRSAYKTTQPYSNNRDFAILFDFCVPCFSISVSLNVLFTLAIVVRLVLHRRNIKITTGVTSRANRIYRALITMLIESCTFYAVSAVLYLGPWGAQSFAADIFFPILTETQVRAVFLIATASRHLCLITTRNRLSLHLLFYDSRTGRR